MFLFLLVNSDAQCVENLACVDKSYLVLCPTPDAGGEYFHLPSSHADKV